MMEPDAGKKSALLVRGIVLIVLVIFGVAVFGRSWWGSDAPADVVVEEIVPTSTAAVKAPDAPAVLTADAAAVINASATAAAELDAHYQHIFTNLPGTYGIRGTNPISGTYHGRLTISEVGSYHSVEWVINSQIITGTGLLYGDTFAASWGDPNCKAIVYQIREDGQLGGAWYLHSRPDEYGLEVVEPLADASENFLVGTHRVFGQNTDGERYYGTVAFAVSGSVYTADWQFDGGDITATGVRQNDVLSFGWGDENCTIAAYTVREDGSLNGVWTDIGEMWLGTEIGEKVGR